MKIKFYKKIGMSFIVLALFLNLAFLVSHFAEAAPQIEINAVVSDRDGKLVNGDYDIRFALYTKDRTEVDPFPSDADQAARIWEETQRVSIKNGMIRTGLGVNAAFPIFSANQLSQDEFFLGIRIAQNAEMTPRKKLAASVFSINAMNALSSLLSEDSKALEGAVMGIGAGNIAALGNGGKFDKKFIPTITKLGNVNAGVWSASVIADNYIDSALTNKTYNGLTVATNTNSFTLQNGTGSQLTLSDGRLNFSNLGQAGSVAWSEGDYLEFTGVGTIGQALLSNGTGAPTWGSISGSIITPNSLDFTEFKNAMILDASTDIALSGNNFTFSGSGNVGIGTTNPTEKLYVSGNIFATGSMEATSLTINGQTSLGTSGENVTINSNIIPSATGLNLGSSSNHWASLFVDNINVGGANINGTTSEYFTVNTDAAGDETSGLRFYRGPTINSYASLIWNAPSGKFNLYSREDNSTLGNLNLNGISLSGLAANYLLKGNGASAVSSSVIYDNGTNVGIGTTNPGALLTLAGSTTARASLNILAGTLPNSPNNGDIWNNGTHLYVWLGGSSYQLDQQSGGSLPSGINGQTLYNLSGTWTSASNLYNNGTNIGVGTTAPISGTKLEVRGRTTVYSSGGILFGVYDTDFPGLFNFVVNDNGFVGIGTTAPGRNLSIGGNGVLGIGEDATSGNNPSIYLGGYINSWGSAKTNELRTDVSGNLEITSWHGINLFVNGNSGAPGTGTQSLTVSTTGNVGIGTTAPGHLLDLGGGTYADSGGSWHDASDINYKKNITPLSYGLNEILKLNPISYVNTTGYSALQLGFSAQEMQKVIPELVEETNGRLSLTYGRITPVLVNAIKELDLKTNKQQIQITGLTDNQNKITNQLTNQLADQTLTVNEKLNLIGQNLDNLTNVQTETIQKQMAGYESKITALEKQIADINSKMYLDKFDALWNFYQNFNLDKIALDAEGNMNLLGKITAKNIEVLGIVKAKDIEAADSLKAQNLELGNEVSGTGIIKAGDLETKIKTGEAISGIKLYITPKGSTLGRILYYENNEIGISADGQRFFKVKIDAPALEKDIEFNWLIVK
jgi:hypothetical protein